jgi:hypothetical protein
MGRLFPYNGGCDWVVLFGDCETRRVESLEWGGYTTGRNTVKLLWTRLERCGRLTMTGIRCMYTLSCNLHLPIALRLALRITLVLPIAS